MITLRLCLLLVGVSIFYVAIPSVSFAQEKKLFNRRALVKAAQYSRASANSNDTSSARLEFTHDLRFDTIDNVLLADNSDADLISEYRSLSSSSYSRIAEGRTETFYDDPRQGAVAERLAMLRTAKAVEKAIRNSPLERMYKNISAKVTKAVGYSTFKLTSEERGKLRLYQGEQKLKSDPLLEFKLRFTARNGVEPKLKVSDLFTIRYDLFTQGTLLEIERSF